MTRCLEKLGTISQCHCVIAQRSSLLQCSENPKTCRVSGTSSVLTDILCRFVVSCLSHRFICTFGEFRFTSKMWHMTSSGERRYIEKDTSSVPALRVSTVREFTVDRERYGMPKVQFTETLYFYINPNVWYSWKKNSACRRIFKNSSRRTQNDGSKH